MSAIIFQISPSFSWLVPWLSPKCAAATTTFVFYTPSPPPTCQGSWFKSAWEKVAVSCEHFWDRKQNKCSTSHGGLCLFNFNYSRSRWSIWIFSWHYEKRKVKKSSSFGRVIVDVSIYIHIYSMYSAALFPFAASSKRNRIFSQPQKAATLRIFFNYLCFLIFMHYCCGCCLQIYKLTFVVLH